MSICALVRASLTAAMTRPLAWTTAMRAGDFPAAWAISRTVRDAADPRSCDDPALPYHRRWVWDGTPVDGREVLVRCYHGLGDTL